MNIVEEEERWSGGPQWVVRLESAPPPAPLTDRIVSAWNARGPAFCAHWSVDHADPAIRLHLWATVGGVQSGTACRVVGGSAREGEAVSLLIPPGFLSDFDASSFGALPSGVDPLPALRGIGLVIAALAWARPVGAPWRASLFSEVADISAPDAPGLMLESRACARGLGLADVLLASWEDLSDWAHRFIASGPRAPGPPTGSTPA